MARAEHSLAVDGSSKVTRLLARCRAGDEDALERVLPLLYAELRRLAGLQLSRERSGHTLQPTALVHEAWLQLVAQEARDYENRRHFLALAATAMRRVLRHHAERRAADKRGGGEQRLDLADIASVLEAPSADFLGLDAALDRLARMDPRAARIVELRFFGGLTIEEVAEVLETSSRTVEREWRVARAWLRRELEALE